MANKKSDFINRLPRNFHKSFIPERQYLNAILRFAAKGGTGDIQHIAMETGIPTGISSGKVDPSLDYCRSMGLITIPETHSAERKPILTPFGRVVLLEDPYLKEPLTQWIAHFQMCDIHNGAEMWFQTFNRGTVRLGNEFTRDDLEGLLASVSGTPKGGLIGPLVRMYVEEASFKTCGVLTEYNQVIIRKTAPINPNMALGYGVWLILLMESIAKPGAQLTLTEVEEKCGWISISGWNPLEQLTVLSLIENKGVLSVDRQMNPWILKANETSQNLWQRIFEDLL